MTPTREQFKEFIAAIKKAQEKEENIDKAFNMMFGLEDDDVIGNELSWWLDEAPKGEAKYWIDEEEHNVSDIDAFYDYLIEMRNEPNNNSKEQQ